MKKVFFIVIICALGGSIFWYFWSAQPQTFSPPPLALLNKNQKLSFTDKIIQEGNEKTTSSLKVKYPRLAGFSSQNGAEVNELLENFALRAVSDYKEHISHVKYEKQFPQSSLRVDYTIAALNNKIFSIKFSGSEYISGTVHPNNHFSGFNYDVQNSKQLSSLKDIFLPGSNYLQMLSELSRKNLKEQYKNDPEWGENINRSTEPKEENFQEFLLTTKGLKILFNPYQIGMNLEEVLIPYKQIETLLIKDSVLHNFK